MTAALPEQTAFSPASVGPRVWGDHREGPGGYLILLIVVVSVIPWQSGSYFTGAFDLVSVAKGALALIGLGAAFGLAASRPLRPVPAAPVLFVGGYLLSSVLGAFAIGDTRASAVIAVRVGIQLTTVVLLAMRYSTRVLLQSLVGAIATVAALATVTGLGSVASGRLAGGFPPMHPNELAFEAALAFTWVVAKISQGTDSWLHLGVATVALVVLLASGSRTTLLALVPTIVVIMFTARAIRVRTGLLIGALVPLFTWAALGTDAVANLISRGEDAAQLATFSNRTIAWRAALAPKDTIWEPWFGSGLATKQIPVPGQWWAFQILDSSWVSALVQGGLVGLALCALWIMHSLVRVAQTSPRDLLGWQLGMVVLLAGRGFLESGLFDASTAFLVLACVTLGNGTHLRRLSLGKLISGSGGSLTLR